MPCPSVSGPPVVTEPTAPSVERRGAGFGVPAIGDPGRAALELSAGPPPLLGRCADHELSECSLPGVRIRAASIRGLLHRYRQEPRQDRFSLQYDEHTATLIVTVCDGVGSLPLSHEAADFVAARIPDAYLTCGDWPDAITQVNRELAEHADRVTAAALVEGREGSDDDDHGCDFEAYRMATTFVGVAVRFDGSPSVSIAWTDDSTVWLLRDGAWEKLTVDDHQGDAEVYTGRVRALPHPEPRFHTTQLRIGAGALFVMSDGVGEPLQGAAEVRDTLASWWADAPDVFTFASQVGFARKSHLDDRTVVGLWFDPPSEEEG